MRPAKLFCFWTDFKNLTFGWKVGPRGSRDKKLKVSWSHCNVKTHFIDFLDFVHCTDKVIMVCHCSQWDKYADVKCDWWWGAFDFHLLSPHGPPGEAACMVVRIWWTLPWRLFLSPRHPSSGGNCLPRDDDAHWVVAASAAAAVKWLLSTLLFYLVITIITDFFHDQAIIEKETLEKKLEFFMYQVILAYTPYTSKWGRANILLLSSLCKR